LRGEGGGEKETEAGVERGRVETETRGKTNRKRKMASRHEGMWARQAERGNTYSKR